MAVELRRDEYGNAIMRKVVKTWQGCHWCGSPRGRLFRYGVQRVEAELGQIDWQPQAFCNICCMRAFFEARWGYGSRRRG